MASLIDLFKGSLYDNSVKQDTETNVEEDKTGLIAKFDKLKGSSDAIPNVKADADTLVEMELTGIRIKSGVDLNNPLIYGNEAIRIGNRTTRTLDDMKAGTHGELGSGGLIGKGISVLSGGSLNSISDVRNKIDDTIGIPVPLIPTRVASKLGPGVSVQDILDGKNGTELGKFLKQTGGGTPKAIVTNVVGNAIKLGKDKLRGVLFGNSTSIGEVKQNTRQTYTDTNPYASTRKEQRYTELASADEILLDVHDTKGINLAKYSPIYGVDRKSDLWDTDLANQIRQQRVSENQPTGDPLSKYDINNQYKDSKDKDGNPIKDKSLENRYGLTNQSDSLNSISEKDTYGEKTRLERENQDLIPFWVGFKGTTQKTHFRALLSGISETVTPAWTAGNFFGNPFEFKTYTGISRNVTFSLQLYCMNENELITMWEKVNSLTKYTYPRIIDDMITPPIIDFRLGHIYNNKIGNISSLSYTFPDEGTWETDPVIGLLPKIIDVSMTIDFIEQLNTENNLYAINEIRKQVKGVNGNSTGFQAFPSSASAGANTEMNNNFSTSQVTTVKTPINTSKSPSSLITNDATQTLNTTPLSTNKVTTPKFDNSLPTYSPFTKG